jgi:hypothetical protein
MSYTEALERLLGEIRKLTAKVDALDERLRGLEGTGAAAAPPPPSRDPEEREGPFGPQVQRSDPVRHQRAVEHAKALNGSQPAAERAAEPEPEEQTSNALQSHQRALQRIREMQGPPAEPGAEPEPEPPPSVRWETDGAGADPELDLSGAIPFDLTRVETQD